jgi:4-hydroxybenzoate polyprenyltransferase
MLQLLRIPNVFTAIADVWMGLVVTRGTLAPVDDTAWLTLISICLYLTGMVLNDVFDVEQDTRERPHRPIPSGRVSMPSARKLGWTLLCMGILIGWLVTWQFGTWRPGIVATLLAACVVLYDAMLKPTLLGPIAMGGCRMLNVLLGMSLAMRELELHEWLIAAGIGLYVAGLTWFAKSEATTSQRRSLAVGAAVALCGIAIIAATVFQVPAQSLQITKAGWYLLWCVIGLSLLRRFLMAIVQPTPRYVQFAVKNGILTLVVIDAGVALGLAGIFWGCAILLLILPAMFLGRTIAMT